MSEFTTQPVHTALKPYVRFYFLMQIDEILPLNLLLTATTDSALIFHFGTDKSSIKYDFPNNPNKSYAFPNQDAWLGGMHNEPLNCQYGPFVNVVIAILSPFGLHHLLREDTTVMLNQGFSIETLGLIKKLDCIVEKLAAVEEKDTAFKLIETTLLNYFTQIDIPFSIKNMSPVTDYIWRQNGVVKVKQLEDKFNISRRWLEKQFAAQIGISPKEYARILRFKSLLSKTITTPSVSWGSLIEQYGYYDQSHLIRDFQAFTGQSPRQYFKTSVSEFNNYFYNGYD
jgi:AraC-like DNA-binding protein